MARNLSRIALLGAPALLAVACDGGGVKNTDGDVAALPISQQQALTTANQVIATHMDDLALALSALGEMKMLGALAGVPAAQANCPQGATCFGGDDDRAPGAGNGPELKQAGEWLKEHVFTEANIEADAPGADDKHVVFRLKPENVCGVEVDDDGEVDSDDSCTRTLTELPVRLTVTSPSEGDVDVAVTVGTFHPFDFQLHDDHIWADAELADVKGAALAIEALNGGDHEDGDHGDDEGDDREDGDDDKDELDEQESKFETGTDEALEGDEAAEAQDEDGEDDEDDKDGEDEPGEGIEPRDGDDDGVMTTMMEDDHGPAFPEVFSGRVRLAVNRNSDKNYTVALSVLSTVNLGDKVEGDPQYLLLQFGARDNVASINIDGPGRQMLAALDVGTVDLHTALNRIGNGGGSLPGTVHFHLAGASISASTGAAEERISVTNVGIGDETSWVKLNDAQILSVDLNKELGRRFGLNVTPIKDAEGKVTGMALAFAPGMVLDVVRDFAPVDAAYGGQPHPLAKGHETIAFTSADNNAVLELGRGLRVANGRLEISAEGLSSIVVEAGMCLNPASGEASSPVEETAPKGEGDTTDSAESTETTDDSSTEESTPVTTSAPTATHPFENLRAGACE